MPHTKTVDFAVALFRIAEQLPADQQPAAVYLSGLAVGSKPAMSQALNSTAQLVTGDDQATAYDIPWHTMRFQHVQKIRQELEADENLSYSTVNKYLAAIRGTLKAAWKLGQMSSEDYYRAVSVENVEGERLPKVLRWVCPDWVRCRRPSLSLRSVLYAVS